MVERLTVVGYSTDLVLLSEIKWPPVRFRLLGSFLCTLLFPRNITRIVFTGVQYAYKRNATYFNVTAFPVNICVKLVYDSRYQDNTFKHDRVDENFDTPETPPALHTRNLSALDI